MALGQTLAALLPRYRWLIPTKPDPQTGFTTLGQMAQSNQSRPWDRHFTDLHPFDRQSMDCLPWDRRSTGLSLPWDKQSMASDIVLQSQTHYRLSPAFCESLIPQDHLGQALHRDAPLGQTLDSLEQMVDKLVSPWISTGLGV